MNFRKQLIEKYFIGVKADTDYLDLYVVRNAIHRFVCSSLHIFEGQILDLGCGIMPYRELIMSNGKATAYIGVDFQDSLDQEYAFGKPDLFWDGKTIPLPNAAVDVVLATELLEHCQHPELVLKEIHRVLKPDGILCFTVPFLWNLHLVPYDEYRFTPFSLKRMLEVSGFTSNKLQALGGWDASLAQMLGIWFQNRPMRFKSAIGFVLKFVIKLLYRLDASFDKNNIYANGVMPSGIGGIAKKNENQKN
jgi:SAM-dependent methyltransferase